MYLTATMILIAEIKKYFGNESVINGVTFSVEAGSITAIVGPSGSGKTTLLNIISGIVLADSGTLTISGADRIGYMLQEPALLPWRTLAENAHLGLELIDATALSSKQLANGLFREFELNGAQNKYPAQCSLGMQQRAALIRTLAIEPNILLLDEPFSSLDYDIKLRVQLNVARYIERMKPAVLLVTHDIEDAIALADKVIVLTDKPASVKAVIDINLDFPKRDPVAARTSPKFREYFELIWQHLKYLPSSC